MIKLKAIIGKNPFKAITRSVIGGAMDVAAQLVVRDFENEIKDWEHPVTFTVNKDGDDQRSVTTDDPIFLYQDLGTKPHTIVPSKKRALAWPGGAHPVKRVHHPGTKPRHFTKRVQAKASARLLNAMNEAMKKAST